MAITNAQQYQQLVNKPANGKRPGYRGPGGYQGREAGDVERPGQDKPGKDKPGNDRDGPSKEQFQRQTSLPSTKPKAPPGRDPNKPFEPFTPSTKPKDKPDIIKPKPKPPKKTNFRDLFRGIFPTTTSVVNTINQSGLVRALNAKQRQKYLDSLDLTDEDDKEEYDRIMNQLGGLGMDIIAGPKVVGTKTGLPPSKGFSSPIFEMPQAPPGKLKTGFKTVEGISSLGDPGVRDVLGEKYDKYLNRFEKPEGRDNEVVPSATPTTTESVTPEEEELTEFEKLLAARGDAFRFFADGGMADDDDPVGGIMDLESGRQMYFLGKLVKKATKTIKKIVKSPVGKAALLGGALYFGGGSGGFSGLLKKGLLKKGATDFTLANLSPMKTIGLASLAAGLMTPKQEEEEQEPYLGPSIDIPAIRRDPYGAMGGAYSFYAEGGKAEPVAKKTMPLLDMDGMEKDYRETGGFVEMGRMERADDVPARLSKNEFVFTADAVRNAGDGNIDKGAEVMYNMMKNLEAGGEVSEESQGLEGARKMFQTSQRLGEVI